jgi:hypothetical protein
MKWPIILTYFIVSFTFGRDTCSKMKFKEGADDVIKLDFDKIGNRYNFLSVNLILPSLDEILDCVAIRDEIKFELEYKTRTVKIWTSIHNFTLMHKQGSSEIVEKDILHFESELIKPCLKYRFKLRASKDGARATLKQKLSIELGPGLIQNIQIRNLTETTANVSWSDDDDQKCVDNFKIVYEGGSVSATKSTHEKKMSFTACRQQEVKLSPIYKTEEGLQTSIK